MSLGGSSDELQRQRFEHQGEEIAASRQADELLQKSHEVTGKMLEVTGELMGLH